MKRVLKLPGLRQRILLTYSELPPSEKNQNLFGYLSVEHIGSFHPHLRLPVGPTNHPRLIALFRDPSARLVPSWMEEWFDEQTSANKEAEDA